MWDLLSTVMMNTTIHCVVFIKKTPQGRRIEEVLKVTG